LATLRANIAQTDPKSCEVFAGDSFANINTVVAALQKRQEAVCVCRGNESHPDPDGSPRRQAARVASRTREALRCEIAPCEIEIGVPQPHRRSRCLPTPRSRTPISPGTGPCRYLRHAGTRSCPPKARATSRQASRPSWASGWHRCC
jgi:hypothetical protein